MISETGNELLGHSPNGISNPTPGLAVQLCDLCGRIATDKHHCLVGRSKKHAELDHEYNLEPLCRRCHMSGKVNSYEHRRWFYYKQAVRYGQDFLDWWHALPLRAKPNYE